MLATSGSVDGMLLGGCIVLGWPFFVGHEGDEGCYKVCTYKFLAQCGYPKNHQAYKIWHQLSTEFFHHVNPAC